MLTKHARQLTLLMALGFALTAASAGAQIRQITMVLDGFCTTECKRDIEHALDPFAEDMESLDVDYATSRVTIVPKENARVQLWDIVRELQNADRVPVRTTVLMDASVEDYAIALAPRARVFIRKVLSVPSHASRFVMSRTGELGATVAAAAMGGGKVSVFGEVPAFDTKSLPILIVRKVKAAGEEWDVDEVAALVAQDEDAG